MVTKLGRIVTYLEWLPPIKLFEPLMTCLAILRDKLKLLYLHQKITSIPQTKSMILRLIFKAFVKMVIISRMYCYYQLMLQQSFSVVYNVWKNWKQNSTQTVHDWIISSSIQIEKVRYNGGNASCRRRVLTSF